MGYPLGTLSEARTFGQRSELHVHELVDLGDGLVERLLGGSGDVEVEWRIVVGRHGPVRDPETLCRHRSTSILRDLPFQRGKQWTGRGERGGRQPVP
jgi:hypothetical protein